MFVWLNGKIIPEEKAHISVLDRGFLFGDGVFTTLLLKEGSLLFFEDHRRRIISHAKTLNIIPPPIEKEPLHQLALASKAEKGLWEMRIYLTRGGEFSRSLDKKEVGNHLITIWPLANNHRKEQVSLALCEEPVVAPLSKIKTMAYLYRFLLKDRAVKKGYDEMLVYDEKERILECSFSNFFWVEKNTFYYPDIVLPYLLGVTLKYLIKAAKEIGLAVSPVKKSLSELSEEAKCFISSSLIDFVPVVAVEKRSFTRDISLEKKLHKAFRVISQEKREALF